MGLIGKLAPPYTLFLAPPLFMWMAIQNRLETRVNLKKKEWKGSKNP